MKKSQKTSMATAIALASTLAWSLATADEIGGGPRADFRDNTLSIPCVDVEFLSPTSDEIYYDVVFNRRGNSMNYELITAEPEDTAMCARLAAIAAYDDDDYSDDNPDPGENGFGILVRCELTDDRSSIQVDAKDLPAGTYVASITSGLNEELSLPVVISDDEVEFEFDSDEDEVDDGALEIDADFIDDDLEVTAEIINDTTDKVVYTATGQCLSD
jgi:hypothetical protein